MSITQLRTGYEAELTRIGERIAALEKRRAVVELVLAELGTISSGRAPKEKAAKAAKAAKAGRRKRRPGGMTARDAVITTLGASKEPLTPKEIIEAAAAKSNCARNSLRAQIGTLTKSKEIVQVSHKGRGYKYKLK